MLNKIKSLIENITLQKIILHRIYSQGETFGILFDPKGNISLVTLERPWLDNANNISCIPESRYKCVPYHSKKYTETWEIAKVKNRTEVLFHEANWVEELKGCIALGRTQGILNDKPAVINSSAAIKDMKKFIGRDRKGNLKKFWLVVTSSNNPSK